jgi:hypothetical protein
MTLRHGIADNSAMDNRTYGRYVSLDVQEIGSWLSPDMTPDPSTWIGADDGSIQTRAGPPDADGVEASSGGGAPDYSRETTWRSRHSPGEVGRPRPSPATSGATARRSAPMAERTADVPPVRASSGRSGQQTGGPNFEP